MVKNIQKLQKITIIQWNSHIRENRKKYRSYPKINRCNRYQTLTTSSRGPIEAKNELIREFLVFTAVCTLYKLIQNFFCLLCNFAEFVSKTCLDTLYYFMIRNFSAHCMSRKYLNLQRIIKTNFLNSILNFDDFLTFRLQRGLGCPNKFWQEFLRSQNFTKSDKIRESLFTF